MPAPIDQAAVQALLRAVWAKPHPSRPGLPIPGDLRLGVRAHFLRGMGLPGENRGSAGARPTPSPRPRDPKPFFWPAIPAGVVHGFSNVCRHRGHPLVEVGEPIDARLIRCPYHAWSYRFDGTLRSAPSLTQSPDFDPPIGL